MDSALGPDGQRWVRASDAAAFLGWTDPRKVRRRFTTTDDPETLRHVLPALGPKPGARPTYVVLLDAVLKEANRTGVQPGPSRGPSAADSWPSAADDQTHEYRRVRAQDLVAEIAPDASEIEVLRSARGFSLEHRERLLQQLRTAYETSMAHVDNELLLLGEMRQFETPTFPPGGRKEEPSTGSPRDL